MYGKIVSIQFLKMVLQYNFNSMYNKIVKLIEKYKTASKYFWRGMDRRYE